MATSGKPTSPNLPVGILGIGSYLPSRCLTNDDLVHLGSPVSAEWIQQKTGILERHVAADTEALSDLAIPAIREALRRAELSADHLDAIIVAGDLHDSGGVQLTSAIVAQALNISGLFCSDLRVGCPAGITALHYGTAMVASCMATIVAVATGEVNTRGMDYTDRTSVWFGDGGSAVLLGRCVANTGILASYVACQGEHSEILSVPAGGSREPFTSESLAAGRHRLYMDGRAVFSFAVDRMVDSLLKVTDHLGITVGDLDWIVPHQANLRIIEAAMHKLGLPMSKAYINLNRVGNTAGASVLLALAEGCSSGEIQARQLIATVGFGGGLAWGAQVIRMNCADDFSDIYRS